MESFWLNINPFWVWLGLACLFLAIEVLLAPSGFFLCLGSAAAIVSLLALVLPSLPWLWALTLFAVLSVIACWLWWQFIRKKNGQGAEGEERPLNSKSRQLIGYRGILENGLVAGKGRLKVNDSAWLVEADADLPAGSLVEVVDVKGITLLVKAIDKQNT